MRYFLGIDGGQSSTKCLIGDETGLVIGSGVAGPCNHVGAALGRQRFLSAIGGGLAAALVSAHLPPDVTFAVASLGLSGGPADKDTLTREAIRADQYNITHDAMIALAGATGGGPGIITIAGTGSISFGRNSTSATARSGGWGYIFGDEGGAFDIVRQAMRAVLRHEEGWGPRTLLTEALLLDCSAPNANDLLHRFYTDAWPRSRVAALARLVDDAAEAGDGVASELLSSAAQHLATITAAVRTQLFPADAQATVCYIGGVFQSEFVRERFRMLVEMGGATVSAPQHGPAEGALLEAYRMAGLTVQLRWPSA